MRGEHLTTAEADLKNTGSSPRARGTPDADALRIPARRFIPACAGNTAPRRWTTTTPPVHPRVRGEHMDYETGLKLSDGSSPRARGTRLQPAEVRLALRFIPACAGNTASRLSGHMSTPVHPRVRGEHVMTCVTMDRMSGSSPRARGTLDDHPLLRHLGRFIPACAGNTAWMQPRMMPNPVHPRVRGEHLIDMARSVQPSGSSPRARGTPETRHHEPAFRRFIPACAGNTVYWSLPMMQIWVHPRVRGEHRHARRLAHRAVGSSPRARGTPRG